MKRRTIDFAKSRRPVGIKKSKISDGIYNSAFLYTKFVLIWAVVMTADFLVEFRFEYLWPVWLLFCCALDSFRYQGIMFCIMFCTLSLASDVVCYLLIPTQWLYLAASTYVWVQYVWYTERGLCLPTVSLWILFIYIETSLRLKDLRCAPFHLDLCRPFAAHCIGYPVVTLGFGCKSYVSYRLRMRREREVGRENEKCFQLLQQALPAQLIKNGKSEENNYMEVTSDLTRNNLRSLRDDESNQIESVDNNLSIDSKNTDNKNIDSKNIDNKTVDYKYIDNKSQNCKNNKQDNKSFELVSKLHELNNCKGNHHDLNTKLEDKKADQPMKQELNNKNPNVSNKKQDLNLKQELNNRKQDNNVKQDLINNKNLDLKNQDLNIKNQDPNNQDGANKSKDNTAGKNLDNIRIQEDNSKILDIDCKQQDGPTKILDAFNKIQDVGNVQDLNNKNSEVKKQDGKLDINCTNVNDLNNEDSQSAKAGKISGFPTLKKFKNNLTQDPVARMEVEVKRGKQEVWNVRKIEQELRSQLTQLQMSEVNNRQEMQQLKQDNEALQLKLHNLVTSRQADKQALSNLERKLQEERKLKTQIEQQLQMEKKKKVEVNKRPLTPKMECSEDCKQHKALLEAEVIALGWDLNHRDLQIQQLEHQTKMLRESKDSSSEVLLCGMRAMREKACHLEKNLSAETRLKMDLFSALGDAKRQIEIQHGMLMEREIELKEMESKVAEVMALSTSSSFHISTSQQPHFSQTFANFTTTNFYDQNAYAGFNNVDKVAFSSTNIIANKNDQQHSFANFNNADTNDQRKSYSSLSSQKDHQLAYMTFNSKLDQHKAYTNINNQTNNDLTFSNFANQIDQQRATFSSSSPNDQQKCYSNFNNHDHHQQQLSPASCSSSEADRRLSPTCRFHTTTVVTNVTATVAASVQETNASNDEEFSISTSNLNPNASQYLPQSNQ